MAAETTFDKFITNDPVQKEKFDKEYSKFLLSEFALEKTEEENRSVRDLAEKPMFPRQSYRRSARETNNNAVLRAFLKHIILCRIDLLCAKLLGKLRH